MSILVIPACLALFIKLYILYSVYDENNQSLQTFTTMLGIFACHNVCEIAAYIHFFHGSPAVWLIRSYYVISLSAMFAMCVHASSVARISVHRPSYIAGLLFTTTLSLLIVFTNEIVKGSASIGYTLVSIKGNLYFLFSIAVIGSMTFICAILSLGYRKTKSSLIQIQCAYTLLAITPMLLTGPIIIFLQHIGWKVNTSLILPITSTFYLIVIILSEKGHQLTDIRTYLPFSAERRATRKLLKLYSNYSAKGIAYKQVRDDCEKMLILYSLEKNDYNFTKTSEMMDIQRSTLYSMCNRLNIQISRTTPDS